MNKLVVTTKKEIIKATGYDEDTYLCKFPNVGLNYIDVSAITNMSCLFYNFRNFNGDVSK